MSDFYTCVTVKGRNVLYRGIENGKRVKKKIEFYPTLFVTSQKKTQYQTLDGEHVEPVKPGDMYETRAFVNKYDDISGFNVCRRVVRFGEEFSRCLVEQWQADADPDDR